MKNDRKLILFDIDGTLISAPEFLRDYQEYLSKQSSQYFGKPVKVDFTGLHGGTERRNLRIIFNMSGFNPSEEQLDKFFNVSGREYVVSNNNLLLPYVQETIRRFSRKHLIGITTGNPELVARKRLESIGLSKYFLFGSFGNESEDRSNLVSLAIDRAKEFGWSENKDEVYVVGDTPKDIEAGEGAGTKTIAVITGSYSKEKLVESDPDHIINNLSELGKVI